GHTYEYKVTILTGASESDLTVSAPITVSSYQPIASPKNVSYKTGNKKINFRWDPEPDRYYGVNIYRKVADTDTFTKITRDPVILSKTKNAKGEEEYGKDFF